MSMKNISVIFFLVICVIATASCDDVKRKPGTVYMPDMAYSRALETYIERDSSEFTNDETKADAKIFYNNRPVIGTVMRGEDLTFLLLKDAVGDSTNYVAAKAIMNPFSSLSAAQSKEAERLYLINCAICHGPKLDGNGPLWKGGQGPFPAQPAILVGTPKYEQMPEGQMFYSVAYGKNLMGSYASQLTRQQRWMIISYIKAQQAANKPAAGADSSATAMTK